MVGCPMRILKVRRGFATNSSSTHSLIVWNGTKLPEDDLVEEGDFGWAWFTASSKEAKTAYLARTLYDALTENASEPVACSVVKDWLGLASFNPDSGYIDHESTLTLPYEWDGKSVSRGYFEAFRDYILKPEIVILGGNDNDLDENEKDRKVHPLAEGRDFKLAVPRDRRSKQWCARKDSRGYWTLFDRKDGTKVRLVFDKDSEFDAVKADAPELVDLKITDHCPYDCDWCYMGSTHSGKHADYNQLYQIANTLSEMRVFEVAIGGGEPTLHPRFWDLIRAFRDHGVIPNFTSRNYAWMREPQKVKTFLDCCGGMAFSIEKPDEIKKLVILAEASEIPLDKLSVQYIVGAVKDGARDIMRVCDANKIRCTLLGYKTTGRGADYKPKEDKWITAIADLHKQHKLPYKVGIDTALAKDNEKFLATLDVPKWCYEIVEGKFSMYIDAVQMKCGASSYVEPIRMRKLPKPDYGSDFGKALSTAFAAF